RYWSVTGVQTCALPILEAERIRLVVRVAGSSVRQRKPVDLPVPEQHVEQGLAGVFRLLRDQLGRPHLLDLEPLGELHQLPEIGRSEERRVGKESRSR